jgi:hypothetical protein
VATLGRRQGCFDVNRHERTILRDRGMSSDHFGSCVVNFGGHIKH